MLTLFVFVTAVAFVSFGRELKGRGCILCVWILKAPLFGLVLCSGVSMWEDDSGHFRQEGVVKRWGSRSTEARVERW